MKRQYFPSPIFSAIDVHLMAEAICRVQKPDGEIPWSVDGKTDPWDHVESAMGLSVAGYLREAGQAFEWSARTQMEDGSWWAAYKNGEPFEKRKDPNMSSYIAVGVYHHYLISQDHAFLANMWPVVSAATDFAVNLQAEHGEILWSVDENGNIADRALLTGSSSIYLSIKCALAVASQLGKSKPKWELALRKLGKAIRCRRQVFDSSKNRYSMDWYYPVLCGAISGKEAQDRFDAYWRRFVVENWGVRCVSDQPWVTMAESSELVLALAGAGMTKEAEQIFSWIRKSRFDDGLYWTGVTCPDSVIWPEERTTWTTAAVLLAADAIYEWTPGCNVFFHDFWQNHQTHAEPSQENKGHILAAAT